MAKKKVDELIENGDLNAAAEAFLAEAEADADDVEVHRQGDVATITFTMPDHDVEVTCTSRSIMGVVGQNNNLFMGIGMGYTGMTMPDVPFSASGETEINTEWICPNCQSKNNGKFCRDCGTPRQ